MAIAHVYRTDSRQQSNYVRSYIHSCAPHHSRPLLHQPGHFMGAGTRGSHQRSQARQYTTRHAHYHLGCSHRLALFDDVTLAEGDPDGRYIRVRSVGSIPGDEDVIVTKADTRTPS